MNEDYMNGYRDGMISVNGYTHAKLSLVKMFVEDLIADTTKPEILTELEQYAEENK